MDRLHKATRGALLAIAVATPAFAQAPDDGKADIIALAKTRCAVSRATAPLPRVIPAAAGIHKREG